MTTPAAGSTEEGGEITVQAAIVTQTLNPT